MEVDIATRYIELVELLAKNILALNAMVKNNKAERGAERNTQWLRLYNQVSELDSEIKFILEKNSNEVKD